MGDTGIIAPAKGSSGIDIAVLGGSRLAMTAIRNGFLWTCLGIGLHGANGLYSGNETGTNVDRSAVQWLKLRVDPIDGSLTYDAHGRVYLTNAYWYYVPSVMANCAGDIVMASPVPAPQIISGPFIVQVLRRVASRRQLQHCQS